MRPGVRSGRRAASSARVQAEGARRGGMAGAWPAVYSAASATITRRAASPVESGAPRAALARVGPHGVGDLVGRVQVGGEPGRAGVVGHQRQVDVVEDLHHPGQVANPHAHVVHRVVDVAVRDARLAFLALERQPRSCMSPRAPRSETAEGSQPDSTPITAITSTGSRPPPRPRRGPRWPAGTPLPRPVKACAPAPGRPAVRRGADGGRRGRVRRLGVPADGRRHHDDGGPQGHRRRLHAPSDQTWTNVRPGSILRRVRS